MPKLRLHYAPRTRSLAAVTLMEELGEPYELKSFDLNTGHHKSGAFLAMNPMGKVPLVVDLEHDVPISETGAIAVYLADRFPSAGLAPAVDEPARAAYLRWIFFSGSIAEPAFGEKFFKWELPAHSVAWGCFADMERALEAGLKGGPYLLGERFTAADVVVGATAGFGVRFGVFSKTGPIADYVARLAERPAFIRAAAIEAREAGRFPLPKK